MHIITALLPKRSLRVTLILLVALACAAAQAQSTEANAQAARGSATGDALPTLRLSPQIRIEGQAAVYADIPCEQLADVRAETYEQKIMLQQRKNDCLKQYRQHLPRSGVGY